jgi:hypothetical protein
VVPKDMQLAWKVNDVVNGNPMEGWLVRQGDQMVYHAPDVVNGPNLVLITASLNYPVTIHRKGALIIEFHQIEKAVLIDLIPDQLRCHVDINLVDSSVSPFYGGLVNGLPIYSDHVSFDVKIVFNANQSTATASNIINEAPTVVPSTKDFQNTRFTWLADPIGEINVTQVQLQSATLSLTDSIVRFIVVHSGAMIYGLTLSNAQNGTIYSSNPPQPFGGSVGVPQVLDMDLKKPAGSNLTIYSAAGVKLSYRFVVQP